MTDTERALLLMCAQQAIYTAQKSNTDDDERIRELIKKVRQEATA